MGLRRRSAGQPGLYWRIRDDVQLEGVRAGTPYGRDTTYLLPYTDGVHWVES